MLENFAIAFDVGLVVLIWMVQLIVYPSFLFYEPKNLITWHHKYTGRISVVVIPLMFGQTGFLAYQIYQHVHFLDWVKLALILFIWVFTFAYFAPTHGKISQGNTSKEGLTQLVRWNWWRTLAWTLVAILSFYQLINK